MEKLSIPDGARGKALAELRLALETLNFDINFSYSDGQLIGVLAGTKDFISQWVKTDPIGEEHWSEA